MTKLQWKSTQLFSFQVIKGSQLEGNIPIITDEEKQFLKSDEVINLPSILLSTLFMQKKTSEQGSITSLWQMSFFFFFFLFSR